MSGLAIKNGERQVYVFCVLTAIHLFRLILRAHAVLVAQMLHISVEY